jgi:hypothetical protein
VKNADIFREYAKTRNMILFDECPIMRARFRVSYRRPGRKGIRCGSPISLSTPFWGADMPETSSNKLNRLN